MHHVWEKKTIHQFQGKETPYLECGKFEMHRNFQ